MCVCTPLSPHRATQQESSRRRRRRRLAVAASRALRRRSPSPTIAHPNKNPHGAPSRVHPPHALLPARRAATARTDRPRIRPSPDATAAASERSSVFPLSIVALLALAHPQQHAGRWRAGRRLGGALMAGSAGCIPAWIGPHGVPIGPRRQSARGRNAAKKKPSVVLTLSFLSPS